MLAMILQRFQLVPISHAENPKLWSRSPHRPLIARLTTGEMLGPGETTRGALTRATPALR